MMKLMTQCNEKGFELEVSTPICVTLFPMQHLMGCSLYSPRYHTRINSIPTCFVNMFSYISMQIKSADNRILQEQLQNKVKIASS